MKSLYRLVPKVIALVLLGLLIPHPVPGLAESAGQAKARPSIYEFGASYCLSCRTMEQIMKDLKERYGGQLEVRMVYADKEKELFQQYKILLIPTQVFLDASGQEVERHIGALSRDEVLRKLRELKFIHE